MTISFWFDIKSLYLQTFPIHLSDIIKEKKHKVSTTLENEGVSFQPKGSLVGWVIWYQRVAMATIKVTHVTNDATNGAHNYLIAGMLNCICHFLESAYG